MNDSRQPLKRLIETTKLTATQLKRSRNEIRRELITRSANIQSGDFQRISSTDLKHLMHDYDRLFFNNLCSSVIDENGDDLSFRVSTRMTSTGGKTTVDSLGKPRRRNRFPRRNFEIAISATLLFESFAKQTSRADARQSKGPQQVRVAGVRCADRLDALQRIFEHEILHLIEFLVWNDSSCAGRRFRSIAWRMFGHEQSNHQLLTPSESAELQQGIGVGDFVCFRHSGHQLFGFVNHINRRATVLVPDKKGATYTDGKKYAKYYVPINQLSRHKK